jgi:hypothetical protein
MTIRNHLASAAICLIALPLMVGPLRVDAHGDWPPKHGGLKNDDRGEISFELVVRGVNVLVYLEDHGEAMSTSGARGVLTFRRGEAVWKSEVTSGGKNLLVGRLSRPLKKDDRVVANVNFRDGSIAEGTFQVK